MERLQKFISRCGYASRRKAEELIIAGKVQVNGHYVKELGVKVNPQRDRVKVNGVLLAAEKLKYIIFNKPKGIITSSTDPLHRTTVLDYITDVEERIYPVGRLDYNTEGLLLLTNDGALAQKLMHPSNGVRKTYEVKIKGRIRQGDLETISKGVEIEPRVITSPAEITDYGFSTKSELSMVEITIHEGRNRQVRRMFERFGYTIHNLKRIAYGFLRLTGLKRGTYRELRHDEVRALKELVK